MNLSKIKRMDKPTFIKKFHFAYRFKDNAQKYLRKRNLTYKKTIFLPIIPDKINQLY